MPDTTPTAAPAPFPKGARVEFAHGDPVRDVAPGTPGIITESFAPNLGRMVMLDGGRIVNVPTTMLRDRTEEAPEPAPETITITVTMTSRQFAGHLRRRGDETGWHIVTETGVTWDARSLRDICGDQLDAGHKIADVFVKTVIVKTRP